MADNMADAESKSLTIGPSGNPELLSPACSKKSYSSPKLVEFGAAASLTKAHSGTSVEGMSAHTHL
jgi:hypothetical protein